MTRKGQAMEGYGCLGEEIAVYSFCVQGDVVISVLLSHVCKMKLMGEMIKSQKPLEVY